jgi:hypothetical protein
VGSRSLQRSRSVVVVVRAWVGSEDSSFRARVIECTDGEVGSTTPYSSPEEVTAAVARLMSSLTQGADPPQSQGGSSPGRR